jgi:uncharacterized protein YjbI with pentapeptide repeats
MDVINETPFSFALFPGRLSFPRHSATFIVKGSFRLRHNQTVKVVEEQDFPTGDEYYPDDDAQTGSIRYSSDFVYFKRHADLFLVGHAHAPAGTPVTSCPVRLAVNDRARDLIVTGDRMWQRRAGMTGVTPPVPFTSMELRYENSFGGAGFGQNPVGKGYGKRDQENGTETWPLPNIEDPALRISHPDHKPPPAGFGPLNAGWEFRSRKLGTYNKRWLEQKWPWFPDDFDPTYFNAAHPYLQQDGYLSGNEMLQVTNMHPEIADYRTGLPGVRVRCFTRTHSSDASIGKSFQEIRMNLDTLWVDMDAEQLVLVWRGWSRTDSGEMEDIRDILVTAEALDSESMAVDECYALLNRRKAELAQELEEEEPEPVGNVVPAADDTTDTEALLVDAEAEVNRAIRDAGLDPDNLPEASDDDKQKEAELLAALGIESHEVNPLTREHVQARVLAGDSFLQEDLTGLDLAGMDFSGADLREADLSGLDLRQCSFARVDLSGANLAGANLTQVNLQGANLKAADLTGATLSGASLEGAGLEETILESCVAQSVNFDEVQGSGADFSKASLRGSHFCKATLTGASFEEADLNLVILSDALLQDIRLDKVTALHSSFSRSDMTGARASDQCDFSGTSFAWCQLEGANFEGARCVQADFSCADMHDVNLIACDLGEARLEYADLRNAKLAKARLANTTLAFANLFEATLEKAQLEGTNLRGANLYAAEFLDAGINNVDFEQANLKMTKLGKVR